MKNKKNILLILIIILIVIQISMFTYMKININEIQDYTLKINKDVQDLDNEVNLKNQEIQGNINQLSESIRSTQESLTETQTELGEQINAIKAKTSADFSGIIDDAVEAVVSIKTDKSQGTGFIITDDGYVVTNYHVIEGAIYGEAITSNQQQKSIYVVGYNSKMDVALLKISGSYNSIEFEDSDNTKIGEKVIAIGNPLGLSFSVTEGIISAVDRSIEGSSGRYIQTDAALNFGNSGGPLINTDGRAIGINNFKVAGDNIGFALESNFLVNEVNKIALEELNKTLI